MEQKPTELYASSPLMVSGHDLEQRLKKKIYDVNSFRDSQHNNKEKIKDFKKKNHGSKKKYKGYKTFSQY